MPVYLIYKIEFVVCFGLSFIYTTIYFLKKVIPHYCEKYKIPKENIPTTLYFRRWTVLFYLTSIAISVGEVALSFALIFIISGFKNPLDYKIHYIFLIYLSYPAHIHTALNITGEGIYSRILRNFLDVREALLEPIVKKIYTKQFHVHDLLEQIGRSPRSDREAFNDYLRDFGEEVIKAAYEILCSMDPTMPGRRGQQLFPLVLRMMDKLRGRRKVEDLLRAVRNTIDIYSLKRDCKNCANWKSPRRKRTVGYCPTIFRKTDLVGTELPIDDENQYGKHGEVYFKYWESPTKPCPEFRARK